MQLQTIETRRQICRACDQAEACLSHPTRKCTCSVDGVDLKYKTSVPSEACPNDKWQAVAISPSVPSKPPATGPGSLLSHAIYLITGQRAGSCGVCSGRVRQMNEWGWRGCFGHRKQIVAWLQEAAAQRGHQIDAPRAGQLLRAAWKEIQKRNKDDRAGQ